MYLCESFSYLWGDPTVSLNKILDLKSIQYEPTYKLVGTQYALIFINYIL